MAKDEIKKDVTQEKFYLTENVKLEGYTNKNYGIKIDWDRDYEGRRLSRFASPGKFENGEFISSREDFLTGLTIDKVYDLAIARVIKIKKDQRHYFLDYLKTIKRTEDDDE